ncbi:MAG: YjbQ family protein, partial [Firmicutes bacterium]|nr:YjbQ family protein [Bacillota bacterium]
MQYTETLSVTSYERSQLIDVTSEVNLVVARSGVREGICHLYVPHTTAGVTVNENADPSVPQDILERLAILAPREGRYRHAEGNADAHIKASLVGTSQTVPVAGGRLLLGTCQGVFFCEFDGPRRRKL